MTAWRLPSLCCPWAGMCFLHARQAARDAIPALVAATLGPGITVLLLSPAAPWWASLPVAAAGSSMC